MPAYSACWPTRIDPAQHPLAEHFWRRALRALAGMRALLLTRNYCIRRRNGAGSRSVAETVTVARAKTRNGLVEPAASQKRGGKEVFDLSQFQARI